MRKTNMLLCFKHQLFVFFFKFHKFFKLIIDREKKEKKKKYCEMIIVILES